MNTDRYRELLLGERDRVSASIQHLHDDNAGSIEDETEEETYDNHLADSATATLNREIDYTLEENSGNVLREIDRALARIDDGTYGTCSACGHAIEPERLEFLPWAAFCASDARSRG
jgi:RNA polymerase-binding transcription factor DksA